MRVNSTPCWESHHSTSSCRYVPPRPAIAVSTGTPSPKDTTMRAPATSVASSRISNCSSRRTTRTADFSGQRNTVGWSTSAMSTAAKFTLRLRPVHSSSTAASLPLRLDSSMWPTPSSGQSVMRCFLPVASTRTGSKRSRSGSIAHPSVTVASGTFPSARSRLWSVRCQTGTPSAACRSSLCPDCLRPNSFKPACTTANRAAHAGRGDTQSQRQRMGAFSSKDSSTSVARSQPATRARKDSESGSSRPNAAVRTSRTPASNSNWRSASSAAKAGAASGAGSAAAISTSTASKRTAAAPASSANAFRICWNWRAPI